MNKDIIKRLFSSIKVKRKGFRRKFLTFTFFLIIAIVIWLLKALEKNYTTEISYPVRYRNFPENKTLVSRLPDHLDLDVFAHGYILLQHKISSRYLPLSISINSFSLKQLGGDSSGFYFLETRYLRDYIDKQLGAEFEILDVQPDTLVFSFAEITNKKVPVKEEFLYQLEQQMIIRNKPVISPDSVLVSGPDYIIDTLEYVPTRNKNLGVLTGDYETSIHLRTMEHTTYDPEKVNVRIEIEKFTEKTLTVPINIINSPDSIQVITFPREVTLTSQVGLSNYEKLQPEMFSVSIDYGDIVEGEDRLKVSIDRSPEFVRSVKVTPNSVEYLIQK